MSSDVTGGFPDREACPRTYRDGLFAGSTVLVTGGTRGIGAATAEAFGALGARVVAAGLDRGTPAAKGIEHVELDVTDPAAVADVVDSLTRLDVVVNCAGIIQRDAEFDLDVVQRVLEVNLTGTMRVCMAARPLLRASRGCVVNIASMHSFISGARVPAYTASKGGISQLTKALANAFAEEGIRVNAVAPGWIRTPLSAPVEASEAGDAVRARTPMGRWGEPDEVADAVVYLASPAARFVTGTILTVDGGYLTR